MTMTTLKQQATQKAKFHGMLDAVSATNAEAAEAVVTRKHAVLQTRDVSYRIRLHQHPYVADLVERLLRGRAAGLLAADTEYVPGRVSLPDSVEVTVAGPVEVPVPAGATLAMLQATMANRSGGGQVELAASAAFDASAGFTGTFQSGLAAVLAEGLSGTPERGGTKALPAGRQATLAAPAHVKLKTAATVGLADGATATIPAGRTVLLERGALLTLPAVTARVVRSKAKPTLYADLLTATQYKPTALVERPYPVKDLDFTTSGAYAVYNWELFYHVPLTLAVHLSRNQRYAEAQRWFHHLFDPTDDSDGPTPERFWKVRPFQSTDVRKVEELLVNLATGQDEDLRAETVRSIEAWKDAPFRPHVIARYRQQAHMYKTVMAYLDNLIAWGDSLFRQDTGETVDEALMLYVLAANILGPRPLPVPRKGTVRPQTYANLKDDLRQFGVVLRDVEADLPFDLLPLPAQGAGNEPDRLATIRSLGKALYFSVPPNDKLLAYWDTVADRLFKIRNSLDIQGRFRRLALFDPPIDPAMLARAAAAGLDVGAIVAGLNQPLPLVRFAFLAQKAAELAQETKGLGQGLLGIMEKEDAEALAILRARQERVVMEMVEQVKYAQLQDAVKAREGLRESLAVAVHRYAYHERQLGRSESEVESATKDAVQALGELDRAALEKMKLKVEEPKVPLRPIEVDIAKDLTLSQGRIMSSFEQAEIGFGLTAQGFQTAASVASTIAGLSHYIPTFGGNVKPWGIGAHFEFGGGQNVGPAFNALAEVARSISGQFSFAAGQAAKVGGFQRREQDWTFQSNLAAHEMNQAFKQLRAAQIREAVAEFELRNHRQQMRHAEETERFLNEDGARKDGKRANRALYQWMRREVQGLHAQTYQFAFDVAKRAERALQHELGDPGLSFIRHDHAAGREGLLAGEKLLLDVKRMEMAYHELHEREYELTKHVSLLQVDPFALLQLRTTGACTVRLPEALFDMDGPGHYFRRIKTVAVSVPCVTGPHASVNLTLTLQKSSIRRTPLLKGNAYAREDAEDDRFDDHYGRLQSVVTSGAQNDSGLFEANLRDERYLPFENSGIVSEWRLELPGDPSKGDPTQFDYDTISDVILHVRYTAREGGQQLRGAALAHLKALMEEAAQAGAVRLFSMRHEFPTEWARFKASTRARPVLKVELRPEHYPYWSQGRLHGVEAVDVVADGPAGLATTKVRLPSAQHPDDAAQDAEKGTLNKDATLGGLLRGKLDAGTLPLPTGTLTLSFETKAMEDVLLAVKWSA